VVAVAEATRLASSTPTFRFSLPQTVLIQR
jgi:hypothetical protein